MLLWRKGRFSNGAVLARLAFEIWAATYYLKCEHEKNVSDLDVQKLIKINEKFFEGCKSDVLMFYGSPATKDPVHILDMVRNLKKIHPKAEHDYGFLCESCHPNFPRYMEWCVIDHRTDNWRNKTANKNGHRLLDQTLKLIEKSVSGCLDASNDGLKFCDLIIERHNKSFHRH